MGQACPHPAVPPVQPPSGHSVTVYLPRGGRGSPLRAGLRRPPHPPAPGTPGRSPPPPRSHRRPGPTAGLRPAAGPEEAPGASGERPRKAAAGDAAHLNGTPPPPGPGAPSRPAAAAAHGGHLAAELHLGVHGGDAHREGLGLLSLQRAEAHAGRDGPGHGGGRRLSAAAAPWRWGGPGPPPLRAAPSCAPPSPPRYWSRAGLVPPPPRGWSGAATNGKTCDGGEGAGAAVTGESGTPLKGRGRGEARPPPSAA